MADVPVIYAGDPRAGYDAISDIFAISAIELPCTVSAGGGFRQVIYSVAFQAGDRFYPRGGDFPVLLAGDTLFECFSGNSWSPVSYFLGVQVSAAFALDGDFLAVLKNGSTAVIVTSPGTEYPRFAVAKLQGPVSEWDIFPQGRAVGSWLGLDAGLGAKRDFDFEVTELEVGKIVFGGKETFFAVQGDFLQIAITGGRIFGLGSRGEVFFRVLGSVFKKI